MEVLYKIKSSELDLPWIESVQKLFKNKSIIIKVSTEMDETDYLTLYPANEKHLLDNIAAEPVIRFTGNEFREYVDKLSKKDI